MKKSIVFLLVSAMGLALFLLWPSDEKRIRRLFKEGAEAFEKEDLDRLVSKVSYNYRDDYGITYLSLKETLKREFAVLSDIRVEYEDLQIAVHGDAATAKLNTRVIATGGKGTGYIFGDIREPLYLRFTLEKERAKWLIVRAEMIGKSARDGKIIRQRP